MSDEQQLPVPSEKVSTPVPRLSSPSQIQTHGLTAERAAKIVNQSGSSRMAALLGIAIVTLFVIVYAFYDQGLPGVTGSSRLDAAKREQYLETVKRGYNLFEANCARCHGAQGQGGIGPVLNDQGKLLAHLTPQYLMNVLTVGGRYICGDANSLMGVWSATNGGPLNYREIEELIAWVRATNTDTIEVRDPATGEMVEVTGWRDVAYAPAADATPVPACWKDAFAVSPTPTGSATPMPSGGMGETYQISAVNPIGFEQSSFTTAAGVPFTIVFSNNNVGVPHNVAIHVGTATGEEVFKGEIFPGIGTRTYNVPALTAGTYAYICTVHPNMVGTLTVK
jgi:plastocyanin/mono/diheme cytochrome c family protein